MRIPDRLEPLVDIGVVQEVVRPLMSGKEAQVYIVGLGGELRVAKVYKDAERRSFKHRADYTEGRTVRNSRMWLCSGKVDSGSMGGPPRISPQRIAKCPSWAFTATAWCWPGRQRLRRRPRV